MTLAEWAARTGSTTATIALAGWRAFIINTRVVNQSC